jgi:hypothetical protein
MHKWVCVVLHVAGPDGGGRRETRFSVPCFRAPLLRYSHNRRRLARKRRSIEDYTESFSGCLSIPIESYGISGQESLYKQAWRY